MFFVTLLKSRSYYLVEDPDDKVENVVKLSTDPEKQV